MRVLMDDAGLDWDTAWNITTHSVAYTNHTVLSEALERWPQELMQSLLPRVWTIITEIARRYQKKSKTTTTMRPKRVNWLSSGTARSAWQTCASRAAWP